MTDNMSYYEKRIENTRDRLASIEANGEYRNGEVERLIHELADLEEYIARWKPRAAKAGGTP